MLAQLNGRRCIGNGILAGLPAEEFASIRPFLHAVLLEQSAVLHEAKKRIEHVYFVESGVVSLRTITSGSTLEIAMIGRQGATGISVVLGWEESPYQSNVLLPGRALRIHVNDLQRAMQERPLIREHLLRHVYALIIHCSQTALCGVRHEPEARLASWLCMVCDVVEGHFLSITHEDLSMALALRRSGVTEALIRFEEQGLLRKMRGLLEVTDRNGLKHKACACYPIVISAYHSAKLLCCGQDRALL
jgi:CRP-like cAMP-binding protein